MKNIFLLIDIKILKFNKTRHKIWWKIYYFSLVYFNTFTCMWLTNPFTLWATCWVIKYAGFALPRQYYIEVLPVHIDPLTIGTVFLVGIGICLLATLYPATEAAKLKPVEGLRFD